MLMFSVHPYGPMFLAGTGILTRVEPDSPVRGSYRHATTVRPRGKGTSARATTFPSAYGRTKHGMKE